MSLFDEEVTTETPLEILQGLTKHCEDCRLGRLVDSKNMGFCCSGPLDARVAFISDVPDPEGVAMTRRIPTASQNLREWESWVRSLGLFPDDVFFTNVVQCKNASKTTVKKGKPGVAEFKGPDKKEIQRCYPHRTLRILKAMPNLEVVVTLGWIAAETVLGPGSEPRQKSHEGQWFGTTDLPGVAIFCLDHPRQLVKMKSLKKKSDKKNADKKVAKLKVQLGFFSTEYLKTGKIVTIAQQMKGV